MKPTTGVPGGRPRPPSGPWTFAALRLRLAAAALYWERGWPALWPVTALLGGFLVVALFDLLPVLPGWLHSLVLIAWVAGLGWALWHARGALVLPNITAARRRLELSSGLLHRPLAVLEDRPIDGGTDPATAALWQAHRQRMAEAAGRLRIGWPRGGLARRDPWGIRAALGLLLVIGAVGSWGDGSARLRRALTPSFERSGAAAAVTLDLWVTPPDYTGLPPMFLSGLGAPGKSGPSPLGGATQAGGTTQAGDQGGVVQVPVGSTVLAQVHGGDTLPKLSIDTHSTDFTKLDGGEYKVTATLTEGHRLGISQAGSILGKWPIAIIPDKPPTIEFAQPPSATPRAALRLDYVATDDYGIAAAKAVIRLVGHPEAPPLELPLTLPGPNLRQAKSTGYQDLTAHLWAGLPVEIRLVATDAIDQQGTSAPATMKLPERKFNNPLAKALVDQRRLLTTNPDQRDVVAETIFDLSHQSGLFHDDVVAFLGMRTAFDRLMLDQTPAAIPPVQEVLWETALRIEDGNVPQAQRSLREAQQALQDALARNAPDQEIERLMADLQRAIDQYLKSLAETQQRDGQQDQQGKQQPIDPSRMLTQQDLQKMMDRARDLARSGARDAAKQALAQLQNLLENLRAATPGEMQAGNQGRQMMRAMQDLQRRQQQLLDRSYRQAMRGQPGQQGGQPQPGQGQPGQGQPGQGQQGQSGQGQSGQGQGDLAGQQEALRRELGEMMRQLGDGSGDIPQAFGRAERAMRDAAEALGRGDPGNAVNPQGQALDQLQQATRALADQMQQQMGNDNGNGTSDPRDGPDRADAGQRRDPLGRTLPGQGMYDKGDVQIPAQVEMQRSREILDELRRRAGDRERPAEERDYIDRLLKRF
ncbi:MAG TPA: TIGR02302 family protein [Stellaceae bacterium]|nr:TIGR02302 family protein [Stellaceae bacterium]